MTTEHHATGPSTSVPEQTGSDDVDQPHHLAAAVEAVLHVHLTDHLDKIKHLVRSSRSEVGQDRDTALPAWLRPTVGEPRWPVLLAVIVAIGLQLAVPKHMAVQPTWLLPGVEAAFLLVLTVANPHRIDVEHRWLRALGLTLVAVASVANVYSASELIAGLLAGREGQQAGPLLVVSAAIWLTNVIVFALWYWEFDRGGPAARANARLQRPDFLFPQMADPQAHGHWEPQFLDYLYLAFTNATAFSPTDTLPLSRWAKTLMMAQSAVSLATVAIVLSRAVSLFR
jgi:hypothetical protein